MSNSFKYKDTQIQVGDTLTVDYRIKEADGKERIQQFQGILIGIKGGSVETRMFTVRKMSKSGIGVERIFPVASPFISAIRMDKKSTFQKAKLTFLKNLSDQALRQKLYKQKKTVTKRHAPVKKIANKTKPTKAE